MKVRNGFVSNSSSSSFMIPLTAITADQRNKIMNHIEVAREMKLGLYTNSPDDEFSGCPAEWGIYETEHAIEGHTTIDNFDMATFLKAIGVDEKFVHWGN